MTAVDTCSPIQISDSDVYPQTLVSLKSAGLFADGRWIVRGVDLEVHPGEIVTLIGPNGSGKSTSAKMALGILKPNEGMVERAQGLTVGYVPQRIFVDWSLPLKVRGFLSLTHKLSDSAIVDAAKITGIEHLLDAQVRNLSGGEMQRVLLARAIARKPQLLVLDEPVQGVDFNGEIALYDLIQDIRKNTGCGILLISHDLHVVMAATDRVICFNGHVCCSGTPMAVSESPEYRKLFGERAAASVAIYQHQHDHTHLPDGRVQHSDGSVTDHCHPDDGFHDHHEVHHSEDSHKVSKNAG